MPKKLLGILAVLAVIVIVVVITSGGSSDSSSEWESPDTATLRMNVESEVPGISSDQANCMVEKIEAAFPPSIGEEIDKGEQPSSDQREKIEEFAEDCVEASSDSESSELSTELPESAIGGPACQEDLESSACEEESNEKIESAQQEEMEIYEEGQEAAEAPLP